MGRSATKKSRMKMLREGKKDVSKGRSIYSSTRDGQNFTRTRMTPTKAVVLNKRKHKQFEYDE